MGTAWRTSRRRQAVQRSLTRAVWRPALQCLSAPLPRRVLKRKREASRRSAFTCPRGGRKPRKKRAWPGLNTRERGRQKLVSRLPFSRTLGWPPRKQGQACWGLSQCLQRVFGRKNCPAVHRGALNRPNSITLSRGGYSPRDACTACPGRRLVTISLEETHRSNNSAKTWPS